MTDMDRILRDMEMTKKYRAIYVSFLQELTPELARAELANLFADLVPHFGSSEAFAGCLSAAYTALTDSTDKFYVRADAQADSARKILDGFVPVPEKKP